MSIAEFFLLETLLWELAERRLAGKYIRKYQPFPLPTQDERLFNTSDVSIIVPTINWNPATFPRAIVSWLSNRPLEIIIVTPDNQRPQLVEFLENDELIDDARDDDPDINIWTGSIPFANKRCQLVAGITLAKGRILALVDDDAIWNADTLLNLLAPFQQPEIGLVGGPIESYVPEERQDASVISAYEVAALRNRSKRRGGNKAFFVRDGSTNFTVSGATMLVRAMIVQEPDFQNAFMYEKFAGVRQTSGDDSFITRWVLFQHLQPNRPWRYQWRLGMQLTPEATVLTTLMTDRRFIDQMKRWLRTGLRFRLICLFRDPGFWNFRRTTPYMCRKMLEGLYNPILNVCWYFAFFTTLGRTPLLAIPIALYYFYGLVSGTMAFLREFPYCRRKFYAAVLADKITIVSDFYSWATLFVENWSSRYGADQPAAEQPAARRVLDLDE
ncbi:nucleotide-diphospho-sugar transferase [Xylaria telfairii]|nr:nucleotide-diphospho-sugar transferase [Xylaria telfairii]